MNISKKEWTALQDRVFKLESMLKSVSEFYGPKKVLDAISASQYKSWRNNYDYEPPAEDMKNHATFAR